MPARFIGIPNIPTEGINPAQLTTLNAMKQNLELLMGQRGEANNESKAIFKGQIKLRTLREQDLKKVTASGGGFAIQNILVASAVDHAKLTSDVQIMANDIAYLRAQLQELINQLRQD